MICLRTQAGQHLNLDARMRTVKSLALQFVMVSVLGFIALATNPASAKGAEACNKVFCVQLCPARPQEYCQAYECGNHGSCSDSSCGGLDYQVTCTQ